VTKASSGSCDKDLKKSTKPKVRRRCEHGHAKVCIEPTTHGGSSLVRSEGGCAMR
jgi:hypothetical protein